jgi:hypothetical protein
VTPGLVFSLKSTLSSQLLLDLHGILMKLGAKKDHIDCVGVHTFDWLINWLLLFYDLLKNFSLIWRRQHNRWRAAKFRPKFWRSGPLSREGSLSCQTCCNTRPRFSGLIRRKPHSVASYDTQGDSEGCPGSVVVAHWLLTYAARVRSSWSTVVVCEWVWLVAHSDTWVFSGYSGFLPQ